MTFSQKLEASSAAWIRRLLLFATVVRLVLVTRRGIRFFFFDDALMFIRYAAHVRSGQGISWNPAGPHTAGLTSPLWLGPVLFGSFFHLPAVSTVVLLSTVSGVLALIALAYVAKRFVASSQLKNFCTLFILIALPLLLVKSFDECLTNGMETMFAMLALCIFLYAAERFCRLQSFSSALLLALLGITCVLIRPESGIVALVFPALLWATKPQRAVKPLVAYFIALFVAVLLMFAGNKLYFSVALPLPFYLKGLHGYVGYSFFPNPILYLLEFLKAAWPALVVVCALGKREQFRRIAAYLLPFMLIVMYLFTVKQIMGYSGRYYMPYLPLLYLPAIEALDGAMDRVNISKTGLLVLAAACCALICDLDVIAMNLVQRAQEHGKAVYPEAVLVSPANRLPPRLDWGNANQSFAKFVVGLPGHPSIALSEAGFVGAAVPQSDVLDLSGLNDKTIALNGQSADYVFAQQPDILWMPENAYTWIRGKLFSDPRMLQQYDLYAGAFNYSVAIRKDSPYAEVYRLKLSEAWPVLYLGLNAKDFRVTSAAWNEAPKRL